MRAPDRKLRNASPYPQVLDESLETQQDILQELRDQGKMLKQIADGKGVCA